MILICPVLPRAALGGSLSIRSCARRVPQESTWVKGAIPHLVEGLLRPQPSPVFPFYLHAISTARPERSHGKHCIGVTRNCVHRAEPRYCFELPTTLAAFHEHAIRYLIYNGHAATRSTTNPSLVHRHQRQGRDLSSVFRGFLRSTSTSHLICCQQWLFECFHQVGFVLSPCLAILTGRQDTNFQAQTNIEYEAARNRQDEQQFLPSTTSYEISQNHPNETPPGQSFSHHSAYHDKRLCCHRTKRQETANIDKRSGQEDRSENRA